MKVKSESEVTQSCPTLSNPMDCSLPGSSVHGLFQARVLEWGAIAFSNKKSTYQKIYTCMRSVQFSSVAQLCPTLCDPMNRSTPGLPVYHQLPEFTQTHVMPSSHLILCRPLLLLPSIPPSIRVFSNESTLRIGGQSTGVSTLASFLPKKSQS